MTEKYINSEWTGIKGKVFAWHLDNPVARLAETLLLGDAMHAFLSEFSRIIRGNEVVLDVGVGTGRFSLPMAKSLSAGKVICLDISEVMLGYLVRKAEKEGLEDRIQILNTEASSTGLDDESVDLVVSNGVFHELSSPETVLSEIRRVLKIGGWVIITDFRDTWVTRLVARHREDAHGPFSAIELETLFANVGFRDLKVSPIRSFILGVAKK